MTPSQSYLFPNDLTQQVDHISFGGLAEDSWVGDIEPEWIKQGCEEKSEMVSKEIGLMKCSGQEWGAFWGDWKKERRTRWPCVKFKRINSDLRKPGRLAHAQYHLRAGTKPEIIHKICLSFLFLPLFRYFLLKIFMAGSRSTFPLSYQMYLLKTNRPLCSMILALGNNV